jgi:hypothetical protein
MCNIFRSITMWQITAYSHVLWFLLYRTLINTGFKKKFVMGDLRFLQHCFWGSCLLGRWHSVVLEGTMGTFTQQHNITSQKPWTVRMHGVVSRCSKSATQIHNVQSYISLLTLTLLTWRIWWAPNNASKWQRGFNSAFKGLNMYVL